MHIGVEEIKYSIFRTLDSLHKNHKDSTKISPRTENQCQKITGYKNNTYESSVFLYSINVHWKTEKLKKKTI